MTEFSQLPCAKYTVRVEDAGVTTVGKNFRDFSDTVWEKFVARADRLESALANEVWPKKKSGLCKNYCPVHTCEHNGKFTK